MRPEGEADTRCVNVDCPAQRVQRIVFFAGRSAMDIEGLGEERVTQFVEAGLLNDAADVYDLTVERLLPLERIGERSAQLLVDAVDQSRTRPLAKLLVGLGIRHVGPSAAQALARELGSLDAIEAAGAEELAAVDGVGGVIALSVVEFFGNERNRDFVRRLVAAGVNVQGPPKAELRTDGPSLDGMTFVLTGTLAVDDARRSTGRARGARRQGHEQRLEEDELRRRGRESRIEVRQGGAARCHDPRRGRVASSPRARARVVRRIASPAPRTTRGKHG